MRLKILDTKDHQRDTKEFLPAVVGRDKRLRDRTPLINTRRLTMVRDVLRTIAGYRDDGYFSKEFNESAETQRIFAPLLAVFATDFNMPPKSLRIGQVRKRGSLGEEIIDLILIVDTEQADLQIFQVMINSKGLKISLNPGVREARDIFVFPDMWREALAPDHEKFPEDIAVRKQMRDITIAVLQTLINIHNQESSSKTPDIARVEE